MISNQIYLGDALDVISDCTEFPDNSVDAVICSPPYFRQRDYHGLGLGNENNVADYIANLIPIVKACHRIIKPTGSICVNMGDKFEDGNLLLVPFRFALAVQDQIPNLRLINEVTWIKSNPAPHQDITKLVSSTEPFFIWGKTKKTHFDLSEFQHTDKVKQPSAAGDHLGQRYHSLIETSELTVTEKLAAHDALKLAVMDVKNRKISGIRMKIRGHHALAYGGQPGGRNTQIERQGFSIIRLAGNTMKVDHARDFVCHSVATIPRIRHPAVFPVELIEEFIRLLVPLGGVVLDPFMGSGSTAVAALNTGRRYVGIEISAGYKADADERLANFSDMGLGLIAPNARDNTRRTPETVDGM